jgi:hypothetical protein
MKHELGQMRTQGSGAIVDCSSSAVSSDSRAGLPTTPPSRVIGEEIAASVVRLCSPGASFIIGVALPVDGGYTAR